MVLFHENAKVRATNYNCNTWTVWSSEDNLVVLTVGSRSIRLTTSGYVNNYSAFCSTYAGWNLLNTPDKVVPYLETLRSVRGTLSRARVVPNEAITTLEETIKMGETHMGYSVPAGAPTTTGAAQSSESGFVAKLTAVGGKILAFFKALLSGDFELIGKGINKVKDFLKNNPISRALRFVYSKAKVILKNPKRWLLAALGAGAFGGPLIDMAGSLLDTGMKVAKEWLPASVYGALEVGVDKVVSLVTRLVRALTDNAPVRYVRALLSKVFKFVRDLTMKVKNYVRQKLAAKFVEVNV